MSNNPMGLHGLSQRQLSILGYLTWIQMRLYPLQVYVYVLDKVMLR
jgi:hypothetical protein